MMKEILGGIYGVSIVIAIIFAVSAVLGMMMNGARDFDMAGLCIVGALFFGGIAWLALYFAGLA
jgi:hypothetical protein